MKSVVNHYLCLICCVLIMLAGIRMNTVNTVALLMEMAIQAIFVVRQQKIQALFLHMYQVGLHPLFLAVFQALYHLIRLL